MRLGWSSVRLMTASGVTEESNAGVTIFPTSAADVLS